jgi:hypothetical protein
MNMKRISIKNLNANDRFAFSPEVGAQVYVCESRYHQDGEGTRVVMSTTGYPIRSVKVYPGLTDVYVEV